MPDADEVLIQVEACGVCHSDVHVADGDWPQFAKIVKRPLILGHEIAGRVAEKGANVRDLEIGDRVGVPWVYWTCGECEFCKEGNENLCSKQKITGVTVDGGYAEYFKAPASHALKIPDGLSPAEAAPLFCAGVTVYRALKQSGISRGQRVAVFGLGGLGHLAVQIGREFGAEVTAVDISDEKLTRAKSLGAAKALNNSTRRRGERDSQGRRRACGAGLLGGQGGLRCCVQQRAPDGNPVGGGIARGKHLLPADYDGRPGSAYQGIVRGHSRGPSRCAGHGRGGKASL